MSIGLFSTREMNIYDKLQDELSRGIFIARKKVSALFHERMMNGDVFLVDDDLFENFIEYPKFLPRIPKKELFEKLRNNEFIMWGAGPFAQK